MKTKLVVIWLIALFVNTGCTHRVVIVKRTPDHRLPPVQAKKITSLRSAKPYAPGQQKKKGQLPGSLEKMKEAGQQVI